MGRDSGFGSRDSHDTVNPESVVAPYLAAGERLLWTGRPRQGIHFRAVDVLLIPFSLLWGGFAIFWEFMVLSANRAPLFFALWGIPFVVAGLYLIVGRFFFDARQRSNAVFAVTNQRVVIVSGLFTRKVTSLNLRTLSEMSLNERADGSGTLTFGPTLPFLSTGVGMAWPGLAQSPAFDSIPHARAVYDIIRKAQNAA